MINLKEKKKKQKNKEGQNQNGQKRRNQNEDNKEDKNWNVGTMVKKISKSYQAEYIRYQNFFVDIYFDKTVLFLIRFVN